MHTPHTKDIVIYFGNQLCSISIDQIRNGNGNEKCSILTRKLPASFLQTPLFFAQQVHGIEGFEVKPSTIVNTSPFTHKADFLITNHRGIGLGVVTADCVPMVIYDPSKQAAAAIHAGWRGSVAGILERTVRALITLYGTEVGALQLIIGPAARGCCYEIGPEVVQIMGTFSWADQVMRHCNGRVYADMVLFNVCWAQELGIKTSSIVTDTAECTICNTHYCSYRRQGADARRQVSLVQLI